MKRLPQAMFENPLLLTAKSYPYQTTTFYYLLTRNRELSGHEITILYRDATAHTRLTGDRLLDDPQTHVPPKSQTR